MSRTRWEAALDKRAEMKRAEAAGEVADDMVYRTELVRRIIDVAKAENVKHLSAEMMPSCGDMRRVCEKNGFKVGAAAGGGLETVEIDL